MLSASISTCTFSSGQRMLSTSDKFISPPIPDEYGNFVPVYVSLCGCVLVGLCAVFVQMPVIRSLNHESIH